MVLETAKQVELVGRRWIILEKLRQKNYYVTELADELGKTPPDVSALLAELKKAELVKSKKSEGERRKYYAPTKRCHMIVDFILELQHPDVEPTLDEIGNEKIVTCLKALDPSLRNEKVKYQLANAFFTLCDKNRVWEHEEVLGVFRRLVKRPEEFGDDKTEERFRAGLRSAMHWMMQNDKMRKWIKENLYDEVNRNVYREDLKDETRGFFLSLLEKVFMFDPESQKVILEKAIKNCFDQNVQKGNKTYEKTKSIIIKCLDHSSKTQRDEVFNDLLKASNSSDLATKEKAEDLIRPFINALTRPEKN